MIGASQAPRTIISSSNGESAYPLGARIGDLATSFWLYFLVLSVPIEGAR
jgi:hypothetical protein